MRALERKVGLLMIEQVRIQANDIRLSSQVFRVATLAGAKQFEPAVKAPVFGNVSSEVFMTVEAQPVLFACIEIGMAGAAVILEFGMPFNDRPRHHQPLQVRRPGSRGNQRKRCEQNGEYARHGNQYMCTANICRMTAATITMNTG